MASNPMQRKSRMAFILGVLATVLVAGLVILLLFVRIKKIQDEKQALIDSQPIMATVYTVSERVAKDGEISELVPVQIDSTKIPNNAITSSNFTDDEGNEKTFKALVDIEPKTIITDSMVAENSDKSDSLRLVEYNMITLPSTLEAGQYIDIRILFANGEDFVVASKKYVENANASTIWLKLGEKDMMTINCAVLESYVIEGTKIYATIYTDAAQSQLSNTYVPNGTVRGIISANSNIEVNSAIRAEDVRAIIDEMLNSKTASERTAAVESGFNAEEQSLKAAREAFLGEIGY